MPKVSQELLGFRILNFEPESKMPEIYGIYTIWQSDILWQKCRVVSKSYAMLCNNCGRF